MDTGTIRRETLILSAGAVFLLDPLLMGMFQGLHVPGLVGLGLTRVVQTLAVIGVVLYFQKSLESIGLSGGGLVQGLTRGALWAGATGGVTLFFFFLLHISGVNPLKLFRAPLPDETWKTLCYFVTGGLVAPVAEEVFFRGVLYRFLRVRGFAFALVLSTAIFASFHVLFSGQRFPVTQIAGGLLFAWSMEKEKTLWVPIIIHATGNIAIFTLSLL